ncbi:UbiA family prenyltransferase [Salinisphaera aquimarina]|uniref:UbiA family prenyltransferase n=2 Tax=Salinisphaera TaxID=180541 RepID=A0ABV7EXR8_9GAMM
MYYLKRNSLFNTLIGAAAMALVSVTATAAQTNTGGAMSTDSSRSGERLSDQGMNPHRDAHSEAVGSDTHAEGLEPGAGSVDSATKGHPMSDHGMAHVRGETEGTMGSDDFDGNNDRPDPQSLSVDSAANGDKSSNYGMEATKPYSDNVNVDPQSHMHAGPHPEK